MSDSTKQQRIEEFLRKSLLGEELINTQFHLFSARSSPSGRVHNPRVLCANNSLLAKSSKYFLDLLSSDINPSDSSLIDLTDDNDVPDHARIEDYGYASDSDLDDCNDPVVISGTKSQDDDESDDESVSSDMFVMSPEQPRMDEPSITKDWPGSAASSETAIQDARATKTSASYVAMRLRSLGSRHILVKDTAFQTWYTLLNYLYTDGFDFLPLGSATPGGRPRESSTSSLDVPRCSAKSMYRLACKVGLDDLRDEAFSYIRSNLTEHNILKEISCSLVSKHQELLDMELDVLYTHIASSPVVANFSALAHRIANRELPHGADIMVGIHTRLLKEPSPLPLRTAPPRLASWFGSRGDEEIPVSKANIPSEDKEAVAGPPKLGPPPPPSAASAFSENKPLVLNAQPVVPRVSAAPSSQSMPISSLSRAVLSPVEIAAHPPASVVSPSSESESSIIHPAQPVVLPSGGARSIRDPFFGSSTASFTSGHAKPSAFFSPPSADRPKGGVKPSAFGSRR